MSLFFFKLHSRAIKQMYGNMLTICRFWKFHESKIEFSEMWRDAYNLSLSWQYRSQKSNIRLQLCGLLRDACDLFPPRWQSRRTPLPIRSHSKTLVSKITQEDQCAAMQFPNGHLLSSLDSSQHPLQLQFSGGRRCWSRKSAQQPWTPTGSNPITQ